MIAVLPQSGQRHRSANGPQMKGNRNGSRDGSFVRPLGGLFNARSSRDGTRTKAPRYCRPGQVCKARNSAGAASAFTVGGAKQNPGATAMWLAGIDV